MSYDVDRASVGRLASGLTECVVGLRARKLVSAFCLELWSLVSMGKDTSQTRQDVFWLSDPTALHHLSLARPAIPPPPRFSLSVSLPVAKRRRWAPGAGCGVPLYGGSVELVPSTGVSLAAHAEIRRGTRGTCQDGHGPETFCSLELMSM
ncbi:unnamed protein product [Arctogadus glacialis]